MQFSGVKKKTTLVINYLIAVWESSSHWIVVSTLTVKEVHKVEIIYNISLSKNKTRKLIVIYHEAFSKLKNNVTSKIYI